MASSLANNDKRINNRKISHKLCAAHIPVKCPCNYLFIQNEHNIGKQRLPQLKKDSTNQASVSVSVVIPAFNEEPTVGDVVRRTHQMLQELALPHEVIVVDDGSEDNTLSVCEKNGAKVVQNGTRMGKGIALRQGFRFCNGDVIITLDADGSHRPEEIPHLLTPIVSTGFDMSIGLRVRASRSSARVKFRMLGNSILSYLISLLTGRKVTDSQSGFRAFKADVVRRMELSSKRFEIESEMLIKAIKGGCRFVEVPINVENSFRASNVNPVLDGSMIFSKILLSLFPT